jgi:exosortase A-associated hydrolase 1
VNVREIPVVFDCQGETLVGMVHLPGQPRSRGLLSIVAGGPQYRGGVGRLQVQLARELAAHGVPVMRFDYRGLGDSEGCFRGFQDVADDLQAALNEFRHQAPGVQEVVLWGGCDAASAVLINAWRYPEVTGVIAGNPFARSEETASTTVVKHHYRKRLRDKDFWLKVLRLQYNPLPALGVLWQAAVQRLVGPGGPAPTDDEAAFNQDPGKPFVQRMRIGLSRFRGDLLFLMSGRSLVTKEFDELVATRPAWQAAMKAPRHLARHDMPDADQTYSSMASRREVIEVARRWMFDPRAPLSGTAPPATGPTDARH